MYRFVNRPIARERVIAATYLRGLYTSFLEAHECAEEAAREYVDQLLRRLRPRVYARRLTLISIFSGGSIVLPHIYRLSFRQLHAFVRRYLALESCVSLRLSRDNVGRCYLGCSDVDSTSLLDYSGWRIYYYTHR